MVVIAIGSVLPTVASFIDWAILLMVGFFFYYVFEAVTFQTEEEKKKEDEGRAEFVKGIQTSMKKSAVDKKKKKEHKGRKDHTAFSRSKAIHVIQEADDVLIAMRTAKPVKSAHDEAKGHLKKLRTHLKHLLHALRELRKESTDPVFSFLDQTFQNVGVAHGIAKNANVPKENLTPTDWTKKTEEIRTQMHNVHGITAMVITDLDKYVRENNQKVSRHTLSTGPTA